MQERFLDDVARAKARATARRVSSSGFRFRLSAVGTWRRATVPTAPIPSTASSSTTAADPRIIGACGVNSSAPLVDDVPPGLITVMSTVPEPAALVASISVSEITLKDAGFPAPKFTDVALLKPLPAMLTLVPPASDPADGDTPNARNPLSPPMRRTCWGNH